jgi:hypothetical protein
MGNEAASAPKASAAKQYVARSRTSNPPIPQTDDDCVGCDPTSIEIRDGEAVAFSLTGCDEHWCYYESPPGGIA